MWKFSWKAIQELEEHQKLLATSLANEAEDSIHIEDEKASRKFTYWSLSSRGKIGSCTEVTRRVTNPRPRSDYKSVLQRKRT